ncbi:leucine zipper protein 2-like [Heterodontus francisci]|uniref:leucine zipper protein 2-like n=1 Tax=Heterodontus francisci TaxID=7792 RepID=UPI00355B7310
MYTRKSKTVLFTLYIARQCSEVASEAPESASTSEGETISEEAASSETPAPSTSTETRTLVGMHSALESESQAGESTIHAPKQLVEAETAEASDSLRTVSDQAHAEPQVDDDPLVLTAQGMLELQGEVRQHLAEMPQATRSHGRMMGETSQAMRAAMYRANEHMAISMEMMTTLMKSHNPQMYDDLQTIASAMSWMKQWVGKRRTRCLDTVSSPGPQERREVPTCLEKEEASQPSICGVSPQGDSNVGNGSNSPSAVSPAPAATTSEKSPALVQEAFRQLEPSWPYAP